METRSNHVLVGAVVLILLALLAVFTVWLARLSGGNEKEYDIFFNQAVDGVNKGSPVAFSGVPSGQVTDIALFKPDPQFVRVRIRVNDDVPILKGTTATIQSVGFTGVSQVALDGAVKGAPPLACPSAATSADCPFGLPTIPTKQGGLGALLNSAPLLLERISTLTERLSELLSDRNQNSLGAILDNTNRLTDALADRGPEIAATLAETRSAIKQAGIASKQIGQLAGATNSLVAKDVRPVLANLNKTIASAQRSAETLEAVISDARPAIQVVSKQTLPEVNQLVQDLRLVTSSVASFTERLEQGGAASLIGSPKLPDYEPSERDAR